MSEEEVRILRELNERQRREEEKKAAELAAKRRLGKGCLIGFALMGFLFLATCVAILNEADTPESRAARAEREKCATEGEAFVYSKELVQKRLRSPSAAEFPFSSASEGVTIETVECGRYKVHAYVDGTNAFGGVIRNNFSALMIYDPEEESWQGEVVIYDAE